MSRSPRATFAAVYERDPAGERWLVHIDGIVGCHTYGRTRPEAEVRILEALALWLEVEPETLTINAA